MDENQNEISATCQIPSKRGHWTLDEHTRFVEALKQHGKNWKKIVQAVGTRSSNQIRSHAQKYFIKQEKKNSATVQTPNSEAFKPYFDLMMQYQYLKFSLGCYIQGCSVPTYGVPVKIISGEESECEDKTRKCLKLNDQP